MAFPLYLAMTAGELQNTETPPPLLCYMACHFCPYTTGISNIPVSLPKGSILILNDRINIHGHEAQTVAAQLTQAARELEAESILLDFQRPASSISKEIAAQILRKASVPVAVTPPYARELSCPVFLPAPPVNCHLKDHIASWKQREIWLEAALDVQQITVTKDGSSGIFLPSHHAPETGHTDKDLHCHYQVDVTSERALFTLWRTREDLIRLLQEAESLGIRRAVGLYQELGSLMMQEQPTDQENTP